MSGLFTPEERLLTPPRWTGVDESLPVVFIGGPVEGTADFQTPFANSLIDAHPDVFVASPRQLDATLPVLDQVDRERWEKASLGRAAFNGVVLFWLAAQHDNTPDLNEYDKAAWAAFTQVLDIKKVSPSVNAHVAIDPEYAQQRKDAPDRYFRRLSSYAGIPIHQSLDELEQAALGDLT